MTASRQRRPAGGRPVGSGGGPAHGTGEEEDRQEVSLWHWAPHTSCGAFRAKRVLVPHGATRAAELDEALGAAPLKVLDLVPLRPAAAAAEAEGAAGGERLPDRHAATDPRFQLEPASHLGVVFRSLPLLRFEAREGGGPDAAERPVICPEASSLLQRLASPIRIVAFVGPGRCGKSSTLSRLAEDDFSVLTTMSERCGASEPAADASGTTATAAVSRANKFLVGHDADPVTAGVDFVAVPHPVPGEGTVLFLDCEGSDNPCTHNTANYRAITTLLMSLASQVVVCTFGACQESNLEDLSATLATREMLRGQGVDQHLQDVKLCLLVIACRFKALNDAYFEANVLADKEGQQSRNETRSLIRSAFPSRRLRTLPHLSEEAGYREAVEALRRELLEGSAPVRAEGLPLSGAQLLELMETLAEQIATLGVAEPAGVRTRIVQQHLERAEQAAEADFEARCLRPLREELEAGFVERLEPRLRAALEEVLRAFDAATGQVQSEGRTRARARLEQTLAAVAASELRQRNEEHRLAEEVAMEKATEDLLAAFEAEEGVPRRPLVQVPQPAALRAAELLAGDGDEGLLALRARGFVASLRCTRVATSGLAHMKASLQHAFARLRSEADLLRETRAGQLEAAAREAQQSFEDALRDIPDHYVADKVLEPFSASGRHQAAALEAFDAALRALPWGPGAEGAAEAPAGWGPWELAAAAARRSQLAEHLEVLFHRVSSRNARVRTSAGQWCDSLVTRLAEDFAARLPQSGTCFGDDELAAWEKERMAAVDEAFAAAVASAQQDEGLPACAEIVAEARRALRVRCWDLWQERLRENSRMRDAAEASAERIRDAALELCQERLPEVAGYIEPGKLATLFEPARSAAFECFETSLAASDLGDHGAWGAALRERAEGALAMAVHRLERGLQEQADAFRREELDRALGLAMSSWSAFEGCFPKLPLTRGLEDSELDRIRVAARDADAELRKALEASCFQCPGSSETALEALRSRTEPLVHRVCEESTRKRQVARRLKEAVAEALAHFQAATRHLLDENTGELPHFLEEVAWQPSGALGAARDAAEEHLDAVAGELAALAERGDPFEQQASDRSRQELADALTQKLEALSEQNVGLRADEEAKATAAVEAAFEEMAAGLPKRPLRRVLAEATLQELAACSQRCEDGLRRELAPLWCSEVRRSAQAALKDQLTDVVKRTRDANVKLAQDRRDGVEKAAQKQKDRFQALCREALEVTASERGGGGHFLDQLTKKREWMVSGFEDEAKTHVGDGVLVERGPWEEELLTRERQGLSEAMDEAFELVKVKFMDLRWQQRKRWLLPLVAFLVAAAAVAALFAAIGGSQVDQPGVVDRSHASLHHVEAPPAEQLRDAPSPPAPSSAAADTADTADTGTPEAQDPGLEQAAREAAAAAAATSEHPAPEPPTTELGQPGSEAVADAEAAPEHGEPRTANAGVESPMATDDPAAGAHVASATAVLEHTELVATKPAGDVASHEPSAEAGGSLGDADEVSSAASASATAVEPERPLTDSDAVADGAAVMEEPLAGAGGAQSGDAAEPRSHDVDSSTSSLEAAAAHALLEGSRDPEPDPPAEPQATGSRPSETVGEPSAAAAAGAAQPQTQPLDVGRAVPTGSCQDEDDDCGDWASHGGCHNNLAFMLRKGCRLSCGLCEAGDARLCEAEGAAACGPRRGPAAQPEEEPGPCRDRDPMCEEWAAEEGCSSSWMRSRCPQSCKVCQ